MKKNFEDIGPILLAVAIALGVTLAARMIVPYVEETAKTHNTIQKPEIPFIDNVHQEQEKEVSIAVASVNLDKCTKLTANHVTWQKWPIEGLSNDYIAKDHNGKIISNEAFLAKIIGQYAQVPIFKGTPLVSQMLTEEDLQEKERLKKLEEEEIKKIENGNTISPYMRALTVPVDQRSAVSNAMIKHGDYIDIFYNKRSRDNTEALEKIRCVKILAIDGKLAPNVNLDANAQQGASRANANNMHQQDNNPLSIPRNITIELSSIEVEELIKHASDRGVIISLRPLNEQNPKQKELVKNENNNDDDNVSDTQDKDKSYKLLSTLNDSNSRFVDKKYNFVKAYDNNTTTQQDQLIRKLHIITENNNFKLNVNKDEEVKSINQHMHENFNSAHKTLALNTQENDAAEKFHQIKSNPNLTKINIEAKHNEDVNKAIFKTNSNITNLLKQHETATVKNKDLEQQKNYLYTMANENKKNETTNILNQNKQEVEIKLNLQMNNANAQLATNKNEFDINSIRDKEKIQMLTQNNINNELVKNQDILKESQKNAYYIKTIDNASPFALKQQLEINNAKEIANASFKIDTKNSVQSLKDKQEELRINYYTMKMNNVKPALKAAEIEVKNNKDLEYYSSQAMSNNNALHKSPKDNCLNSQEQIFDTFSYTNNSFAKKLTTQYLQEKDVLRKASRIEHEAYKQANQRMQINKDVEFDLIPMMYQTKYDNTSRQMQLNANTQDILMAHYSKLNTMNTKKDSEFKIMYDNMLKNKILTAIQNTQIQELEKINSNQSIIKLKKNILTQQQDLYERKNKKDIENECVEIENRNSVKDLINQHLEMQKEISLQDKSRENPVEMLNKNIALNDLNTDVKTKIFENIQPNTANKLLDTYIKWKKEKEKRNDEEVLHIFKKTEETQVKYSKKTGQLKTEKENSNNISNSNSGH